MDDFQAEEQPDQLCESMRIVFWSVWRLQENWALVFSNHERGKEVVTVVTEAVHVEEGYQEGSLGDSQISGGVPSQQ